MKHCKCAAIAAVTLFALYKGGNKILAVLGLSSEKKEIVILPMSTNALADPVQKMTIQQYLQGITTDSNTEALAKLIENVIKSGIIQKAGEKLDPVIAFLEKIRNATDVMLEATSLPERTPVMEPRISQILEMLGSVLLNRVFNQNRYQFAATDDEMTWRQQQYGGVVPSMEQLLEKEMARRYMNNVLMSALPAPYPPQPTMTADSNFRALPNMRAINDPAYLEIERRCAQMMIREGGSVYGGAKWGERVTRETCTSYRALALD